MGGVYQAVNGELSLGQLIAFELLRYVTGPILRLSGLQGFQQVGISMQTADIVDQVPETGSMKRIKYHCLYKVK